MTVWCGYANAKHLMPYIDNEAPKEYMNGVKYGSPAGLMQIMRSVWGNGACERLFESVSIACPSEAKPLAFCDSHFSHYPE